MLAKKLGICKTWHSRINARTGKERWRANQMRAPRSKPRSHAEAEIHARTTRARKISARFQVASAFAFACAVTLTEPVADMSEKRRALRHLSDAKRGNSFQRGYGTMQGKNSVSIDFFARDPTCQLSIICDGTAKSTQARSTKYPFRSAGVMIPKISTVFAASWRCDQKRTMEKHGISQSRRSTQLAKRLIARE